LHRLSESVRNKHLFLLDCPDLVIVDEAHGAASASERNQSQHQRHELVSTIAAMEDRHLVMMHPNDSDTHGNALQPHTAKRLPHAEATEGRALG